jgi:hypothetical protein
MMEEDSNLWTLPEQKLGVLRAIALVLLFVDEHCGPLLKYPN